MNLCDSLGKIHFLKFSNTSEYTKIILEVCILSFHASGGESIFSAKNKKTLQYLRTFGLEFNFS